MWCEKLGNYLLGSHFIEGCLLAAYCRNFMQNELVADLWKMLLATRWWMWIHHVDSEVTDYAWKCSNKMNRKMWMGVMASPVTWLNFFLFWLWHCMKCTLYHKGKLETYEGITKIAGGIRFEVKHIYWEHAWSDAWHYAYIHRVVILKIWWSSKHLTPIKFD